MGNCLSTPKNNHVAHQQSSSDVNKITCKSKPVALQRTSSAESGSGVIEWNRMASCPQIGEWLKQVPIFCRVPEDKRNKLGGVMETMVFKAGQHVFQQGDEGDRFYIIKQGTAAVTVNVPAAERSVSVSCTEEVLENTDMICKEVARLKQGDYFGETALLSKAKRNATITAVNGDLITLTLNSETFKQLFRGLNVQLAKRKGITENVGMSADDADNEETEDTQTEREKHAKSEHEIKQIVDIFNSSVLFERLNIDQKTQIAQFMWTKTYGPNEEIGKKGEILSNLYIIKSGTAYKFIERSIRNTVTNEKETVFDREELSKGSFIGEIGLMYNSPLQCTYKTNCVETQETEFWIINRKKFRKIVKDSSQQKLKEFESFIKTVPILGSLLDFERKRIAETLEEIHFNNNHVICQQGDIGDTFYIIRKGTAVVTKRYNRINGKSVNEQVCELDLDSLGNERDDAHIVEEEVVRLGPGDFFGERALIKNDVRAATVTVTSDNGMECLMLDREGFTLLLGPLGDIMKRKIDTEYDGISISIDGPSSEVVSAEILPPTASGKGSGNDLELSSLSSIGTLGKGSFGHVELVTDSTAKQKQYYALKTVHKSHVIQLGQQEHIINEKRVLLSLAECPFIIKLHTTFKDVESVYFLLEPVLGGELFALLRDRSAFDEATSAFYAACVVEAFDFMHSKHILYRDLKPENLLLSSNGYLKVTDFGFAKFVTDRTWTLCGTPDYLAPEVVSGIGHNKAVDWWTLGILIYEMVSSYPPFYDEDPMQTYTKIMHGNIDYPRHFSKNVIDLIKNLLHPKPTKRLGIIKGGTDNIRQHPWFRKTNRFDWKAFNAQKVTAPYIPDIQGPTDLSNFEEYSDESVDAPNSGAVIDDGSNWDAEF